LLYFVVKNGCIINKNEINFSLCVAENILYLQVN